MSLTALQDCYCPPIPTAIAASSGSGAIDATGEKFMYNGHMKYAGSAASKNITKVGFRFASVTKAGGSALTVSLQNVSAAAGPPYQADGTPDQTVAIANADAGFVSNVFYMTAALSAERTVTLGERLAIVVEFDGAGRLGADTIGFSNCNINEGRFTGIIGGCSAFVSGALTLQTVIPNCIFEFSDGTFGTFANAYPFETLNTVTYNVDTVNQDEVALKINLPFEAQVYGAWALIHAVAGADFELVLYEGTTAVATTVIDSNSISVASQFRVAEWCFPPVTIKPNTDYYLSLKPTTTNNVQFPYFELDNAAHMQAHAGGTNFLFSARVGAGSWAAATATRRPFAGLRFSAFPSVNQPLINSPVLIG